MSADGRTRREVGWAIWFVVVLAAAFHLVIDLPIGPAALRLSAADLVLPVTVGLLLRLWQRQGWRLPVWRHRLVWPGLAAMTASLTLALAIGWAAQGHPSGWALTNKFLGWFILLAFFLAGALTTSLLPAQARQSCLRMLFLVGGASCAWSLAIYEALALRLVERVSDAEAKPWHEFVGLVWGDIRMTGWLVNANSFAFMIGALLLLLLPFAKRETLFSRRGHCALLTLYMIALINNGSRAAAGGLLIGFLALAVLRQVPWGIVVRALGIGTAVSLSLNVVPTVVFWVLTQIGIPSSTYVPRLQVSVMLPNSDNAWSLAVRLEGYYRAWDLWLQHPWTGIGLGSFLAAESARGANPPLVIHSTWLWLLTEVGPLGLLSGASFFLATLWSLWPRRAGEDVDAEALQAGMFVVIVLFGVMALAHELLYQRHLWFLLGLVLTRGKKEV